jgi:catalase
VGTNYLQLPINAPKKHVATNQRDGQMQYRVDTAPGQNKHVNYEPSSMNGLKEVPRTYPDNQPYIAGNLMRQPIDRTNNFKQAGERYRTFEDWERDDLINNLVDALSGAQKNVQDNMIALFSQCDEDYGRRVREGLQKVANGTGQEPHGQANAQAGHEAVTQAEEMAHEAKAY